LKDHSGAVFNLYPNSILQVKFNNLSDRHRIY